MLSKFFKGKGMLIHQCMCRICKHQITHLFVVKRSTRRKCHLRSFMQDVCGDNDLENNQEN
jgi:hypothetical protein